MTPLLLVAAVALSGVDSLGQVSLLGVTFKGPTQWTRAQPDENSLSWEEPQSGATFSISVYPVNPERPATACVGQLVDALGKEGFSPITLGAKPAAKKITSDYVGEGEAAKVDANRVTTTTVTGCNGKRKWVLTWTSKTTAGSRFGPMLKRVLESISYGR